jgi:hypothetical protein
MASFTTVITEFSDKENSRTYSIAGHTVQKPMLLIQKRKVPATQESNASSEIQVVFGTEDANGDLLASKVVFLASCRYPANAISADITAALADFRDFVASDEFTAMVSSQDYLQ